MPPATAKTATYIIAARRTALGRPGGLHRNRRLESLTAPIIEAALNDAKLGADAVDEIILGNTTAGGNPARIIGLAGGLRESAAALTVDRQCASGLDAILLGAQAIALGDAEIVVAGGAESISTAPWRVAKPKSLFQTPRFIGLHGEAELELDVSHSIAASEELAARLQISREQQDAYTLLSCLRGEQAREARRFANEIVPLRMSVEEARDETGDVPDQEDLASLTPLIPPDGTHTVANTSALCEGAAMVVLVSARVHADLGAPKGLRLLGRARRGMDAGEEAHAPLAALQTALERERGIGRDKLAIVETSEISAAQALALSTGLGLEDGVLSPDGGALARGYPLGAAGALGVVRLFSGLVRNSKPKQSPYGAVTQGAVGGLGVAALFQAV
jgi:acetyl-CoA C-acetyltransferase